MNKPKNICVELLKNNSIRLSLTENVTHYLIKEKFLKFPIQQRDLLACYALLQTDKNSANEILDALSYEKPLPWPMDKVKFNQYETFNPITNFKDVVYTLNLFKNQITDIIHEYEEGFEVQQMVVV